MTRNVSAVQSSVYNRTVHSTAYVNANVYVRIELTVTFHGTYLTERKHD